jgi:peptide/nickel transport system ATP-binding protein
MNQVPLFEIKNMIIDLYTENVSVRAVDNATLKVEPGEMLAIVGESGSGKTVLTLGPLGLLPEGVSVDVRGEAYVDGQSLLEHTGDKQAKQRGTNFGVIFQDPISALNPMLRIGPMLKRQAMRLRGIDAKQGREVALSLLRRTGIPDPEDRYNRYPHEMSGGMLQRAMIALALAGEPKVLIADEPTTALDATVQAQILELIKDIQRTDNIAVVLITHDIGVVAAVADHVVVLYAGQIVESGPVRDVLTAPVHPYTKGLLASVPDLRGGRDTMSEGIPGTPPDQSGLRAGCPFDLRCNSVMPICATHRPPLVTVGPSRAAACHANLSPTADT